MLYEGETLAIVSHGLVLTLYRADLTDTAPTLDLWRSLPFASATWVDPQARAVLNRFAVDI
jgi:broad specificity phosphatase PhoE